jgi:tetratricopeptide (TPR) repeat protein
MNHRTLAAFVLVVACRTAAFAAPPDDTAELAEALIAHGWPDLAEDLVVRTARERSPTWDEEAVAASARLAALQTAAYAIEDAFWRKEALLDVLAQTDTFLGRFRGTTAAETRTRELPDLHGTIGGALVEAIRKSQDADAIAALQTQGETVFARAEKETKARIDLLAAAQDRDEDQDWVLMGARYHHARLLYLHATVFRRDTARLKELCAAALAEYEEFDLDFTDTYFNVYTALDKGLCLRDLDRTDEALAHFDQAIGVREAWGPADEKTGLWPIPSEADYVADVVAYATLQKLVLLRDVKRPEDAVTAGKDWFASMRQPFASSSSMVLARELAEAQRAIGDTKGAVATAESMVREDPDGWGGAAGRELLGRAAK